MTDRCPDITALIQASRSRDAVALGRLVEAVYPELRTIALSYMRRERPNHTLQCTGLISEAYLRLAHNPQRNWKDRTHFFGIAAQVMREVLVDYARARRAAKRGGGIITVALAEHHAVAELAGVEVLSLHQALEELDRIHPGQSHVVELRYFGGLSIDEAAEVMGVSPSTVRREWIVAKTWIHRRISGRGPVP